MAVIVPRREQNEKEAWEAVYERRYTILGKWEGRNGLSAMARRGWKRYGLGIVL